MEKKQSNPIDPEKKKEYNHRYYQKIRSLVKSTGVELHRGRPKKIVTEPIEEKPKRPRGRPKKDKGTIF